jgi:hypothetical protein
MATTHRQEVEAILAGAHAEHRALLERVSPALRASLPVDATGITQAIEHLAAAIGRSDELAAEQARRHRANPAVLHGRVFGRAPLSPDTVVAAFAEGARVREGILLELAQEIGGGELVDAVRSMLGEHPLPEAAPDADAEADADAVRDAYAAQERAAVRIADALDA